MSVQTLGARDPSPYVSKPAPSSALAHIPGDDGWPLIGHTLGLLADPKGFVERRAARWRIAAKPFAHAKRFMT